MWLFGVATGMLGWTPEVAWHTPVPEILVAMRGKTEWTRISNPFGSSEPEEKPKKDIGPSLLAHLKARAKRAE